MCAFGESSDFPAFYTSKSGYQAPHRVSDAQHAAKVLRAAYNLRLSSGIVVAVPIPQEYAMNGNCFGYFPLSIYLNLFS